MSIQEIQRRAFHFQVPSGMEARIRRLIERGQYGSVSEFVRDAIRRRLDELESAGAI